MKVALLTSKRGLYHYTIELLRHLCRRYGVIETAESEAEALWVSVCDPDDLPVLRRASTLACGRPVIMGGFEAYAGVPYLAWANAVVVGEGFEFIRAWAKAPDDALALPCVLHRGQKDPVLPSYIIDWDALPVVKVSSRPHRSSYYFLSGRGCKAKCQFCATGWCQPHSVAPARQLDAVRRTIMAEHGGLTLISNDSQEALPGHRMESRSVRVHDYLRDPDHYRAGFVRFGIEGWTERARREMGKPLADSSIRELFQVTKVRRQMIELFFIVGYPGFRPEDIEECIQTVFPVETDTKPLIYLKMTYFDPYPHTPWQNAKTPEYFIDRRKVYPTAMAQMRRLRIFPARSLGRETWRTVLHRCTPEQAIALGPEPDCLNCQESRMRFRSWLNCCGLLHLTDEQSAGANDIIRTRVK